MSPTPNKFHPIKTNTMQKTHYLFAWESGEGLNERFYVSKRRINRPEESITTQDCGTRQGRNAALNVHRDEIGKDKVIILRKTNPTDWLKQRAKDRNKRKK